MRVFVLSVAASALLASALLASAAVAGDCCGQPACCEKSCGPCGQQMTCQIVCDIKKVKKTVWAVKCVPICVANPNCEKSCGCCNTSCCESDCGEGCGESCGGCDPCAELLSRPLVRPKCGKVRYRKILIKKTIVCEVPIYKCIPVSCGFSCGEDCGDGCGGQGIVAPKEEKSSIKAAPLPPKIKSKA